MQNMIDTRGDFKACEEFGKFITANCASCDATFQAEWRILNGHAVRPRHCRFCVPNTTIKGAWK